MAQLVQWSVYTLLVVLIMPQRIYSYPLAILFLLSLYFYGKNSFKHRSLIRGIKAITTYSDQLNVHGLPYLFIGYFTVFFGFFFIHNEALSYLDKPVKLLAFALITYLLLRYPLNLNRLLISINLSAIAAGLLALYQRFYLGQESAFLHTMRIQAGDIAMSMGLFSLLIYFYYKKQKFSAFWVCLALLATLMGISASFFSLTRGGWIALPLLATFFLIKHKSSWRYLLSLKSLIISLLLLVVIIQSGAINRIQTAGQDIVSYQLGDKKTSVGARFELWKSAIYAFHEKPFLGWGEREMKTVQLQQADSSLAVSSFITQFSHAHNQYLEALSKRGLVGLLVFLLLLGVPLLLFVQQGRSTDPRIVLLRQLGFMHLFLLSIYCFSQGFFVHNSGLIFYALMTTVFYTTLITQRFNHAT